MAMAQISDEEIVRSVREVISEKDVYESVESAIDCYIRCNGEGMVNGVKIGNLWIVEIVVGEFDFEIDDDIYIKCESRINAIEEERIREKDGKECIEVSFRPESYWISCWNNGHEVYIPFDEIKLDRFATTYCRPL